MQLKFILSLLVMSSWTLLVWAVEEGTKAEKTSMLSTPLAVPLPSPMHEIPVEKLDFDPNPANSCVSVEGPRVVTSVSLPPTTQYDGPTSCALELFKDQLDERFKDGTQSNQDTIDNLKQCFMASNQTKHAVIIGHGNRGMMSTGNGPSPGDGQSFDASDLDIIDGLRALPNVSDVLLYGCETGVGQEGMDLLNRISERKGTPPQKGFRARARNSVVICSLNNANSGARK